MAMTTNPSARPVWLLLLACLSLFWWPESVCGDSMAKHRMLAASEVPATPTQPPSDDRATADRCSAADVAGRYRTGFGPLSCEATSKGLNCCYASKCQNKVELVLDEAGRKMSGTWRYPTGTHGPVQFPISERCKLQTGKWNYAGRTTADRPWPVIDRE
jgi:hypothetical protein